MLEDQDLVWRHLQGDAPALAQLVTRYEPHVAIYARRLVGDTLAAEEIVQDTFLRMQQEIAGIQAGQPFGPWLFSLAWQVALAWLQKDNRQPAPLTEASPGDYTGPTAAEVPRSEPTPEEIDLARKRAALVHDCIDGLPIAFRNPLVLCDLEALPMHHTADILGLPVETVGRRLYRARQKLRECLAHHGFEV